jgi:uncharacterized protein (DUF58 family)
MKRLLWSLLKLNAIALALLLGFVFWLESTRGGRPGVAMSFLMVAYVAYVLYLNVRAIYRARQEISASLQDGAVNAAASAIEFRDAARARVHDRLEERRQRSDSDHS